MAYYLMIPRRQLPLEGKLLDFITMRSPEHYITDHIMESCSVFFHTKRHMMYSEKPTMIYVKLTNPDPSLVTDFEEFAITSRR